MARYQDLTREQAVGVEARILQRLPVVLEISEQAIPQAVGNYFAALLEFSYCLVDIAIGNSSFEDSVKKISEVSAVLRVANFISERTKVSAESPLLIAVASGAPGHVSYMYASGLHERDKRNPELSNSLSMAASGLANIGMLKEVFVQPAEQDCAYVLASRQGAIVDPKFFERPLWPEGAPWAVENVLFQDWQDRMSALGLSGLGQSFKACISGIHAVSNKSTENGITHMTNNVTLNFSNGSSFTGPLAVGENIRIAYDAASHSGSKELAEALEKVVDLSSKAIEHLANEDDQLEASALLKTFSEEAKKEKPSKKLLNFSGNELVETVGKVAGAIGSVSVAVATVIKLING